MDNNSTNNQNINNNNNLNDNGLLIPKPIPKLRIEEKQYNTVISTNKSIELNNNVQPQIENKLTEFKPHILTPNNIQDKNLSNDTNNKDNGYLTQYIKEESFNMNKNSTTNLNSEYDMDLIIAFMGLNYEKLINSKFSLPTFFLGFPYFFYRKMFGYGLILYILEVFLIITNLSFISLILRIGLALLFSQIYANFVGNKIKDIINKNPGKTKEELKLECSKKGNTSILMVLVGYLATAVISGVILLFTIFLGITTIFTQLFSGLNVEIGNEGNATEFNGIYMSDSSQNVINEIFEVSIPTEFETAEDDYDSEFVTGTDIFDSCKFRFSLIDNYSSAKVLANQMDAYYNNLNTVTIQKINNIEWQTFSVGGGMYERYYYIVDKDKKVYMIEYQIGENADKKICSDYQKVIINSVKIK